MKTSTMFNHGYIYFFYVILFTSIFLVNESNARPSIVNAKFLQENDSIKIKNYLIKITHNSDKGYGYDIYVEKRLFIHQATIPAIPGNGGFATKDAAEKV